MDCDNTHVMDTEQATCFSWSFIFCHGVHVIASPYSTFTSEFVQLQPLLLTSLSILPLIIKLQLLYIIGIESEFHDLEEFVESDHYVDVWKCFISCQQIYHDICPLYIHLGSIYLDLS